MGLRYFDIFRRIQTEQELSSSTGGIFTIFSLLVAIFLISLSLKDFTQVQYLTSLVVRNDPNEYLPTKINITFDKAPCQLVTISFHDELEFRETQIQNKLNLTNIEGQTEIAYTFSPDRSEMIKRADEGVIKNRQCRVIGTLQLPKTPGTLTFDMMGKNALLLAISPASIVKVRSSYVLKSLEFGNGSNVFDLPVAHRNQVLGSYIKGLEGDTYSRQNVQDMRGKNQKMNYYNHLKVVPIFIDDGTYVNEGEKQKYRFSLRSGSVRTYDQSPKLEIQTEIEPIHIVYQKYEMSFYELAIDILAIVGGSVATIGVFNALSHFLFGIK